MKKLLLPLFTIAFITCQAQKTEKFNLDFESQSDQEALSDGWYNWGDYATSIDTIAYSGKKSAKIKSDQEGSAFGAIAYDIPARYSGQTIQLEGYMKIKNVEKDITGLFMQINGNGRTLAYESIENQNIIGTKDWQKYSITLNYSEDAENIIVGGLIKGIGEAWFDDFVVKIDGKNVQTLKEKEAPKAQLDQEFDDGSLIEFAELTDKNIHNLELLGRIWGFLKYHHPEIAQGNLNWDYELFRFLPNYVEVKNNTERDNSIIDWIDSLGKIDECLTCEPTDENAFLKPDLDWIDKQDTNLKNKLLFVYKNRSQSEQYYISKVEGAGNPKFKNENAYSGMSYPDEGFRLLSLYRYWNMIKYFFPYKHLMDEDWNNKLSEYIPLFINAEDELEYELAAVQLIGDIKDTHANLWGGGDQIENWKGKNYPPFHVRFIEDQLVVTDYYNEELKGEAGLEIGDIITKINGQTTEELIKEKSQYYPASNQAARLRDLSPDLLRSSSEQIEIEYSSEKSKATMKSLQLYPKDSLDIYSRYRKNEGKSFKMLDNNIGYITIETIKQKELSTIQNQFKDTKGIIIDMRYNPSAFVAFSLGSYFVSSKTPFVKYSALNMDNPGEFYFSNDFEIDSQEETYKGKLIVLVNEITQSSAEFTSMAFRAGDNTTILGSTTAGADGNVSSIMLPGGLRTMISGFGVYYPDGEETQRVGIRPDVEVKPTIEGIRQGKDEILEKAIDIILSD
ncbi:peptidase S41 [Psychroflexus gondwanensis]|jgi:C-terminal processing protease CtpA/Prc|uniref:S41 family peptidase n=1 Tax=Psychroflexus gondwanensis TaxID=251 RepID=UPI0011BEA8D5|nr:S41 family peptidase [Psychroflexus gondwanensis]TXE17736.1 peptidase S41 [Psychroflexus gondwanensis]